MKTVGSSCIRATDAVAGQARGRRGSRWRVALCSIAAPTSLSVAPGWAAAIPAASAALGRRDQLRAASRELADGDGDRGVGVVAVELGGDVERDELALFAARAAPGTPWTISSSTLMQIEPG